MAKFEDLGLKKDVVDVLARLKFTEPFEVQEKVIPLTMQGKNVVFTSETGSGKTLAYSIGFLPKLNKKQGVQMLVIVPTRELCIQVGKEMKKMCDKLGLNVGVLYGGRDIAGDYKTLNKRNQVIVAAPGRLIEHINFKRIKIGDVKHLIFDESDQMFDNGFYDACAYIKKRSSKSVQVILSSATLSDKVTDFMELEIGDYELLKIGMKIPKGLVLEKLDVDIENKNEMLLKFFQRKKFKRAIVFCNTKLKSYDIAEFLYDNKIPSKSLSSDLSQDERNDHLNLLKEGKVPVLVTTDVAARGLHIKKVDIVVNYDVPPKDEFFVHRIGRSGRAGKKGYAMTFVCPEDSEKFEDIVFDYDLNITDVDEFFKRIN